MDLFSSVPLRDLPGTPLPERLRPTSLQDLIGQEKPLAQIRRYVASGFLPNLIFWGPPGTGKTTVAQALAQEYNFHFLSVNAVQSGAKELREIGESARQRRVEQGIRTLFFVDEIHRFNKSQQDVLLPFIERGDLVLVGATTENPSYELNQALLSRCRLIVFERLTPEQLEKILNRAFQSLQMGSVSSVLSDSALHYLVEWCDGDARKLLTAVEEIRASHSTSSSPPLTVDQLQEQLGSQVLGYDKSSEQHYDVISAFIKSVRGSDADAALYYLARMLKGGEDINFIARRLVILASEDIGNADPRALQIAVAGAQAVDMIGLPEAAINLAHVVCYLASAPKSNRSYLGLQKAKELVERYGTVPIPLPLRSSKTSLMKSLGYGHGYIYPHDEARGWTSQRYLPEEVELQESLYQPREIGFEKQIKEFIKWVKSSN